MRCSMLNLYMDEGYNLKNMGPILSLSKAYTIPLQMQSHGMGMTLVSIKQLSATLQQKSMRTQKQSKTKLDNSLKYNGAN
jgi:hypothetical protein